MPITKSAKKALRQSAKRRIENLFKAKALKAAIKDYKKAPSAKSLSLVYKQLDKTAKTNVIPKNKASRLKSRLSKILAKKTNR